MIIQKFILFCLIVNFASSCNQKYCQRRLKNWAGNVEFGTSRIAFPSSTEEVIEIVKNCTEKLHVFGSGYSFSSIASTDGVLISLASMNKIIAFDPAIPSITFQAGLTYSDLVTLLDSHGYALQNLASISGCTIAGAAGVSAHGSGIRNGNLASQLLGMRIVLANGTAQKWNRTTNPELMDAASVHLGALGIITELTLKLEPSYKMETHFFERMNWTNFVQNFDQIVNDGYSVTMFFDWNSPDEIFQIWLLNKIGDPNFKNFTDVNDYFGATPLRQLHLPPMDSASPGRVSPLASIEPWYRHLLYLGLDHGGWTGAAVATEYFVPLKMGPSAIEALRPLANEITAISMGNEFRVVAPDTAWMSTTNGQNINGEASFAIDMAWNPTKLDALFKLLPKIEKALEPFNARPHWGKLFTMKPAKMLAKYSKYEDFRRLVKQLDPRGKFMNDFLRKNIFI